MFSFLKIAGGPSWSWSYGS